MSIRDDQMKKVCHILDDVLANRPNERDELIVAVQTVFRTEQRWIPCSERLPRDGSWNIFTDGINRSVERYKRDAIDHFYPSGRWFELEDAIAWMPLPEPYEEEKK